MSLEEILKEALKLKSQDRMVIIAALLRSIEKTDVTMDAIWAMEAERRLRAYRAGALPGVPMEDLFPN